MMPRRNRRPARGPRRPARVPRQHVVYLRDTCGKLLLPTWRQAVRLAGGAHTRHDLDPDDVHFVYHCRWNSGYHLSSRTASQVDARRAHHLREEASPR